MNNTRKVLFTVLLLFVALLITVGLLLAFLRPWSKKKAELPLGIPESEHPKFIQVFTLDGSSTKTNDTTKYTVNKYTPLKSLTYEYCLKDDAKCTQVNYEDKVFWNYSDTSTYGYPKSFYFDVTEKRGSVHFKDHTCYYRFDGSRWNLHFTTRENCLIDLDLDKKEFSEKYFFKRDGQYTKYTPDFGCSFKSVKSKGEVLWKAEEPKTSCSSVIVNNLPDGSSTVTVKIINGLEHVFMVNSKN